MQKTNKQYVCKSVHKGSESQVKKEVNRIWKEYIQYMEKSNMARS